MAPESPVMFAVCPVASLATSVRNSLTPDATVLACHRLHECEERILATETLHGILDSILGLQRQTHLTDADFVIDVWKNPISA